MAFSILNDVQDACNSCCYIKPLVTARNASLSIRVVKYGRSMAYGNRVIAGLILRKKLAVPPLYDFIGSSNDDGIVGFACTTNYGFFDSQSRIPRIPTTWHPSPGDIVTVCVCFSPRESYNPSE